MEIFVARQPIFDTRERVMGYELIYRQNQGTQGSHAPPGSRMSSQVIVDAVLGMGLMHLAGGRTVFINFNREMLVLGVGKVLEPKSVVIDLEKSIRPDPEVMAICRDLVSRGFRLSVDHSAVANENRPLVDLARIVRVDALDGGRQALEQRVELLRPFDSTLLAQRVESATVHEMCTELGFELFQGFHYFKPEIVLRSDRSTRSVAVIRLLNLLKDPNATDASILERFKIDPELSFKLLRMVNSAALGGCGVDSLTHALRLLGRDPLHRWLSLLLVSGSGGGSGVQRELLKSALLRGRMCELVGEGLRGPMHRDVPSADALFLVGLFSRLDVLLGMPMEEALSQINLSADIVDALRNRGGRAGAIISGVEAYEATDWDRAEQEIAKAGADVASLPESYLDAVAWAGNRVASHDGSEKEPARLA